MRYVKFRSEPDADGSYEITDLKGSKLGTAPHDSGPEQRAAVAKIMGVTPDQVKYSGDDEDDAGTFELWGTEVEVARVPLNRQIPKLDHTLASVMHGIGMADILFGRN